MPINNVTVLQSILNREPPTRSSYEKDIEKYGYYPLNEEEHKLVLSGTWKGYINAIKLYRTRNGVGLRQAKDAVDVWSGIEGKCIAQEPR